MNKVIIGLVLLVVVLVSGCGKEEPLLVRCEVEQPLSLVYTECNKVLGIDTTGINFISDTKVNCYGEIIVKDNKTNTFVTQEKAQGIVIDRSLHYRTVNISIEQCVEQGGQVR